jgi:hypothetical protein
MSILHAVYDVAKEWQTLIAALIALGAAWWTIRAMMKAATLQADASLRAAMMVIERDHQKERQAYEGRRYAFARAIAGNLDKLKTAIDTIKADEALRGANMMLLERDAVPSLHLPEPANFVTRWDELELLDPAVQKEIAELLAGIQHYNDGLDDALGRIGAPETILSDLVALEPAVDRAKKAITLMLAIDEKTMRPPA